MKAKWNGEVIAESNDTIVIEGNHYFPPNSIKKDLFKETNSHTTCPWKGQASYYDIEVNGYTNKDAARYYPEVSDLAKGIKPGLCNRFRYEIQKRTESASYG